MDAVLSALLSTDNATRKQGEELLDRGLVLDPATGARNFCAAMLSDNDATAALAAVLFRRKLFEEQLLAKIAPPERQILRAQCLALVSPQRSLYFLKRLSDVLVNFAVADGWATDLLGFMATWARSPSPTVKEFSMHLFEQSVDFKPLLTVLRTHAATVMEILMAALLDTNVAVELSAAKTIACFLEGCESEESATLWSRALPTILKVLLNGIKQPSSIDAVKSTMESLNELTAIYPLVWTEYLSDLISVINEIAKDRSLENESRVSAVAILTALIGASPVLVQSNPLFLQEAIVLGLTLMAELTNVMDEETWNLESDEDDVSRNDMFVVGKDILCSLSCSAGGPLLLATMSQLIPRYLKSPDWVMQHTGVLAIGLIGEGCRQTYKDSMGSLLDLVLPFAGSQNSRLKWAALTSIGLLVSQFQPLVQVQFHEKVIPSVVSCISSGCRTRVQTQATSCLTLWASGLMKHPEALPSFLPYAPLVLKELSERLGEGLATGCCPLLEEVLSAIGHIAVAMHEQFSQYFSSFVPGLKQLVGCAVVTEEQKEVRANCVWCLSAIVESTCHDRSHLSAITELFSYFMTLRQTLSQDDPFSATIEQVVPQFALYFQDYFKPYLPTLLPELLAKATAAVESQISDADTASTVAHTSKEVLHMLKFELRGRGMKQLVVNSSALLTKIAACKTIAALIANLQAAFQDFCAPTMEALAPLIVYRKSEKVRKYALRSAVEAMKASQSNLALSRSLLNLLLPNLISGLRFYSQSQPYKLKNFLSRVVQLLSLCSDLRSLGVSSLASLCTVLGSEVAAALQRCELRQTEIEKLSRSPLHREICAELHEEDQNDLETVRLAMEFTDIGFKAFRREFTPLFQQHFQQLYFGIFYKERPSDTEIISAVCVLDQLAEFAEELVEANGKSFVIEHLIGCSAHPNVDIRQSAIYGLGVCAQVSAPSLYDTYSESILNSIFRMLRDPQCRSGEFTVATDCAVGALGKVAVYKRRELLETWVQWLPISAEVEEAQAVNGLFLRNIDACGGFRYDCERAIRALEQFLGSTPPIEVVTQADLPLLTRAHSLLQ